MKPIGPIGKLQNLNLRDGDWVVCVEDNGYDKYWTKGNVYESKDNVLIRDDHTQSVYTIATFQRLHNHDPRCFGFEEKTRGGFAVKIYATQDGVINGYTDATIYEWDIDGTFHNHIPHGYDLIPLTPPTEFEVLGHRFATRKEAEDAMEIKEVLK